MSFRGGYVPRPAKGPISNSPPPGPSPLRAQGSSIEDLRAELASARRRESASQVIIEKQADRIRTLQGELEASRAQAAALTKELGR